MTINGYGLFRDFTTQEAEEMKEWATNIVLHGKVAHPDPRFVTDWMESHHYDGRQRLLTITCALPQRVLLSLVMYQPTDKEPSKDCPECAHTFMGATFCSNCGSRLE